MIPKNVLECIRRNQYYIGYGQTLQQGYDITKPKAPPKTSFISLFQYGKYLCKVVYYAETDKVGIEFHAGGFNLEEGGLQNFFFRILKQRGARRWINPKNGEKMAPPKDLESLFEYSSDNSFK